MNLPDVTITNILYATDLSENARYAFAYAVSLANQYGAKITILHVIPQESETLDKHVVGYVSQKQWEQIKSRNYDETRQALIGKRRDNPMIREVLDQFSRDVKQAAGQEQPDSDEVVIERGQPVDKILDQARTRNCDLIVMGSHGHSSLADVMMGTITKRVLRRSEIPVLVVRLPAKD